MLTEIKLNGFASFKHETCLQTDKPVNFVYGLNGTGKSSISRYLKNPYNDEFSQCSIDPEIEDNEEIIVYNQDFIRDNFVEHNHQQGVFTLSKENKKAYEAIKTANDELAKLEQRFKAIEDSQKKSDETFYNAEIIARDKVWELKGKYYGGDRVLDYCLEGVKGSKANLFSKVKETIVAPTETLRSIEVLKQDLIQLTSMEGKFYSRIPMLSAPIISEGDILLVKKVIVGNQNSTISSVMEEFANATWVRAGINYIDQQNRLCPFCHERTISDEYISQLRSYFDESYENDIKSLKVLEQKISEYLARIYVDNSFNDNPIIVPMREKYLLALENYKTVLHVGLSTIRYKIEHPNIERELDDCKKELLIVNDIISEANKRIDEFNDRVSKLSTIKESIREEFWKYQRREYESTILTLSAAEKLHIKETTDNNKKKEKLVLLQKQQQTVITNNQKEVVNIDEAIIHINRNLHSIGITDFHIVKCDGESAYRIIRGEEDVDNVFQTLSEGEKMLISFLYFIEKCNGRKTANEIEKKKIIVIDDPISSLSHIHVFNVSCLIRNCFIDNTPFEQVFIFTHSLYFFYEIVYRKKEKRDESQKLFRIAKNSDGSYIEEMKYSEIRNDYEAYWSIINDQRTPPVVLANCMRNILDYFFGFVNRLEFNNIFNIDELKDVRFTAFNHYMNRESHNGAENISDFKEINYDDFHEALKLVFEKTGFGDHYRKMKKIGIPS